MKKLVAMIHIKQYSENFKSLWNDFNKNAKNGLFMFNRDYMDYHSDRFQDHSLLFYEDDKLLALLPLNFKDRLLYSHEGLTFGGFVIAESMRQGKMFECFMRLQEYMRQNNFERLIYKAIPYIYHKYPAQEDLYALFRSGANVYRVDCSSTLESPHFIALAKGRKSQISRAKRECVEVEYSNDFCSFITLLNEVLQARHNTKATHSAYELKLLHSKFKENIALYLARKNSEILAAALLFIYPNLVHTQYLAVNDEGRKIGALDLLIKTLIDKFAKTKRYFDFGISTENNGLYLNQGLIAQKEGFGARTITHNFYELLPIGGGGISSFYRTFFIIYSIYHTLFYKIFAFMLKFYKAFL